MRFGLWILLTGLYFPVSAQVFMRPFDNAAAHALGGAVVAYPGTAIGLANDATPGFGEKIGVFLGSALPYGIGSWQTANFQGYLRLSPNDGLGLDVAHSGIETFGEQRYRLQYGRRLSPKILLGGSVDVLQVSAQEYGAATAATFGLSVLASPLPDVWLGARVQNPVQIEIAGTPVPSLLRLGAAWKASTALILMTEVEKDLDRPSQVKVGIEYRPLSLLALRVGFRSDPARLGFGAGIHLRNGLQFDLGCEWHPTLGLTPAAMLVWRKE